MPIIHLLCNLTISTVVLTVTEESTCSNWRSLMCDSKCIANSSICDGEKDCLDGKDEENCPIPNSCLEWWRAGYTESGLYKMCGYKNNKM